MKKKWIAVLAAVVVIGVAGTAYWVYNKPYDLPAIAPNTNDRQFDLDFTKEKQVMNQVRTLQADQETFATLNTVSIGLVPMQYDLAQKLLNGNAQEKQQAVTLLKLAVQADPSNLVYSNALRLAMVSENKNDELMSFFNQLNQNIPQVRVQKALLDIDGLQNPSLGTASLGQLSVKSINELNAVLDQNQYDWVAHYARGLNNLYWPIGLGRIDKSVQDLAFCLAVLKKEGDHQFAFAPLVYEAYGDALVKKGNVKEGMAVWVDGAKQFPQDQDLQKRAEANQEVATALVREERGIDSFQRPKPSLTDLSMIWK